MIPNECWRNTRITPSDAPFDQRQHTALQRLERRYRRFSIMALLFAAYIPLSMGRYVDNHTLRIILMGAFAAYMLTCSAMDHHLTQRIRAINVVTMPVNEVLTRALHCRKRHLQFVCILLPCAMALLGFMAYCVSNNPWMLGGMAVGAVLGLIVGTCILRRFLADYRALNPPL